MWHGWYFDPTGQWIPILSAPTPEKAEERLACWCDSERVPDWKCVVRRTQPTWLPVDPTPLRRAAR
jgi:hypothetical protein